MGQGTEMRPEIGSLKIEIKYLTLQSVCVLWSFSWNVFKRINFISTREPVRELSLETVANSLFNISSATKSNLWKIS